MLPQSGFSSAVFLFICKTDRDSLNPACEKFQSVSHSCICICFVSDGELCSEIQAHKPYKCPEIAEIALRIFHFDNTTAVKIFSSVVTDGTLVLC